MPIQATDNPATRSIAAEIEVPGTPEQVWQAIATGPGISAWFTPAEVEERKGGAVVFRLGAGMDSTAEVTAWEPPHRFAYEERDWSPGAPPLATEVVVETRAGGHCLVRLVSSLFTSSAEWDDQLASMERGWPPFFHILRLYLSRFAGQPCSSVRVTGHAPGPEDRAWAQLGDAFGLANAQVGERRETAPGAPRLSGVVDRVAGHEVILRLDEPAPGAALIGAFTWEGRVLITLHLFLYGEQAAAVVAGEEAAWWRWMEERYPVAAPGGEAGTAAS